MTGPVRLRFLADLPAGASVRPQKLSPKSLFQNTFPVSYSFHRSKMQNFPYPSENREFRGGRGVPVPYRFIVR